MKKIILSFLLILTVSFLSWCSSNKDELFEKKQECMEYKDEMAKQIIELWKLHWAINIDEIFYSKKDNTCYYTSYWTNWYILFDYLGNKFSDSASITNLDDIKRLKEKIKELKWE